MKTTWGSLATPDAVMPFVIKGMTQKQRDGFKSKWMAELGRTAANTPIRPMVSFPDREKDYIDYYKWMVKIRKAVYLGYCKAGKKAVK